MYFLIHCDEDGEVSVVLYSREELLEAIKDEDYGPIEFFTNEDDIPRDPQEWGSKVLIVERNIIVPKPVQVVKEYEI